MIFQNLTISELGDFITSDIFQKSAVLPITTHRALSQLQNPRAKADDVVLIIAIDNHEIVGYIGLLPDDLYHEEIVYRVAWLSCWWVQDGTGNLGIQLFLKACQAWKRRMVITDFTPHIKTIIKKMRLFHFAPTVYGIRGFMRFNTAEVLPPKKAIFKTIQPLLKIGDTFANLLNVARLKIWKIRQSTANYHIKQLQRIDSKTNLFIQKHQNKELIKRGAKELNWILDHPWILEDHSNISPSIQTETQRYYFSSLSPIFQYYPLQIFQDKRLIAVLFLMNRNGHFKLPYAYFEKEHLPIMMSALFDFLYQKKATTFTVFLPELKTFMETSPSPFFYKRLIPKDFAIGKGLDKNILENAMLQDGDGDYVFA